MAGGDAPREFYAEVARMVNAKVWTYLTPPWEQTAKEESDEPAEASEDVGDEVEVGD